MIEHRKSEEESAWQSLLSYHGQHNGPFIFIHRRFQLYLNKRDEGISHSDALDIALQTRDDDLPQVVFVLNPEE